MYFNWTLCYSILEFCVQCSIVIILIFINQYYKGYRSIILYYGPWEKCWPSYLLISIIYKKCIIVIYLRSKITTYTMYLKQMNLCSRNGCFNFKQKMIKLFKYHWECDKNWSVQWNNSFVLNMVLQVRKYKKNINIIIFLF